MSSYRDAQDCYDGEIPISALEHHAYCPRQAALIHVDGIFTDDRRTAQGQVAHQAVDTEVPRSRSDVGARSVSSLPVRSDRLGVFGVCDQVVFEGDQVVPVEHKVGAYVPGGPADVQVAAQALCLREAGLEVPHGVVFSYHDRRRHQVELTGELLARVERVVVEVRKDWASGGLPPAVDDARCRRCSLREDCLPGLERTADSLRGTVFVPRPLGDWDA